MRDSATMPKLADDVTTGLVNGVRHSAPGPDLILSPEARAVDDALALLGHSRAFGHDQASGGALSVIFGHQRRRNVVCCRASARHRRHPNAVGQRKAAEIHWREQVGHGYLLLRCGVRRRDSALISSA